MNADFLSGGGRGRLFQLFLLISAATGAFASFTVVDGVITDSETGLQWIVGPDQGMSWYDAQDWVNGLGGSWRMPTMDELQALYESGVVGGDMGHFSLSASTVWSKDIDGDRAWAFLFYCDPELRRCILRDHPYLRAFAVCSDGAEGVEIPEVIEYCGLQWRVGPDRDMTFDEACDWVCNLSMGTEWRCPTRDELQALCQSGVSIDNWGRFQNGGYRIWTGEVRNSSTAWYIDFNWQVDCFEDRSVSEDFRAFAVRN